MEKTPKLSIQQVSKWFKNVDQVVNALDHINLTIEDGEFLCLVGPSGCGKTTLLNLIAGLDRPDHGAIFKDGKEITGPGSDRLMMFQESSLFPWLNVMDNVLFGLKLKKELNHEERKERAQYFLKMVGLEKFMYSNTHELSGGMKQRVALARSLAPDPQVLLMDEPFASLDALTREQLYIDMQKIWSEQHKTIVFVTHNVSEAVCLGDRVVIFSPHPGQVKEEFLITLPRFRDIRTVEVAQYAADITRILKTYVKESVAP
jgi:NitT/TauT family transport system ATP-binding protein